jgi:hypothetical protein
MAKAKPSVKGLFERTETAAQNTAEEKAKLRRPIGVYVRKDVRIAVEQIAKTEGLSRHAILSYAVSYFVRQYKAGKVKIETEQQTKLKLDV